MDEENKKNFTDDDDLVARYVLGQVTPEEKERIEAELADNEAAQARIRDEQEFAAGIRRHGRDMMKAQLRSKLRRARAAQFTSYHYIGLAAAVLFIMIGIGAYQIWLSDLVAPKTFKQQEVLLTPQEEESGAPVTSDALNEPSLEPQKNENVQEQKGDTPERSITSRQETSGVSAQVASKRSAQEVPAAAMAEPDAVPSASNALAAEAQPQSIWLIGKVVMVSDRSVAAMSKMQERSAAKEKMEGSSALNAAPSKRRAKDAGIQLQQRAINDLPAGFSQRKDAREQSVQTLLERSETGLSLTLYGDAVNDDDLQEAVVETFTDDSLVVSLPHQRIAFRLPAGWGAQQLRR